MAGLISRTIHFAIDATLLAGLLGGIKKTTGYTPNLGMMGQAEVERYVQKYLDFGDYVYAEASGMAVKSDYFKKL